MHNLGTYGSEHDAMQAAQASLNVLAIHRGPLGDLGPGQLQAAVRSGDDSGATPPRLHREDLADGWGAPRCACL